MMQIGMIGLGRMGANMVRRLVTGGHECVVYDRSPAAVEDLVKARATGAASLADLVNRMQTPRAIWMMVPAGVVEALVTELAPLLAPGDILIDGGNSHYVDDIRIAKDLAARQIQYVDCGTSGGVWGLERGYCLMIGGPSDAVQRLEPVFKTLAPGIGDIPRTEGRDALGGTAELGYLHCGPSGAGHFVKVWRRGSVISSWLLDLTATALVKDPALDHFEGHVSDSGEGRWTIKAAVDAAVPVPVLSAALYSRFSSRGEAECGHKLLSAMRFEFGGHVEKPRT